MNLIRIFGVLLLAVGAVLIVVGLRSTVSAASPQGSRLGSMLRQPMTQYVVGGGAVAILGALVLRPRSPGLDD